MKELHFPTARVVRHGIPQAPLFNHSRPGPELCAVSVVRWGGSLFQLDRSPWKEYRRSILHVCVRRIVEATRTRESSVCNDVPDGMMRGMMVIC